MYGKTTIHPTEETIGVCWPGVHSELRISARRTMESLNADASSRRTGPGMHLSHTLSLHPRGQAEIRSAILCIFSAPSPKQRSALILVAPLIAGRRTSLLSRPSAVLLLKDSSDFETFSTLSARSSRK